MSGKLKMKPGVSFEAGKLGTFIVGENGEIVYGKPMILTKETVDRAGF